MTDTGYTYRVSADIRHLDGPLSGIVSPDGYAVRVADYASALKLSCWVQRVRLADDFVRAAGTGSKYQFASEPRVVRLP